MSILSNWFFFLVIGFVLGYLLGRVDSLYDRLKNTDNSLPAPKAFSFAKEKQQSSAKAGVAIDERKYVAPIKTDGLARSDNTTIGKTTTTEDDIQASVSKLAQLKGK